MSSKDDLIKNLHKLYREDLYVNELWNSVGLTLDNLDTVIDDLEKEYWFDTMTENLGIPTLENILQFKTDSTSNLDDRRSQLEARWKSDNKADIHLIKAIANSWNNGNTDVKFINSVIQVTFVGTNGLPDDLDNIYKAIEYVKPVHLLINYELISITDMSLYFGTVTLSGETITVYPWTAKEIETKGTITIGSAPAINAEITTIYP